MPLAVLHSRTLRGIEAIPVSVEAHIAPGLPQFNIVGLPDAEVREARDRVRAAIQNSGFEFPARRITVNLAPADIPKSGSRFDLPIALGILASSGQIQSSLFGKTEFVGELALNGGLRSINGALPIALGVAGSGRALVVPHDDGAVAALADSLEILPGKSLMAVCAHLMGKDALAAAAKSEWKEEDIFDNCLSEVKGQTMPKRALEIAAAGGHSVLMQGPPGSGKSMLASRFAGLLPPLSQQEAVEAAAVQSVAGIKMRPEQWRARPCRAPHHSASGVALIGGGSPPRPGEISLAHNGVLFLDELPEFERNALEMLREPLESGQITISRAAQQATYPARFQLIVAMNPCPCGFSGDRRRDCRCTPAQVRRYRARLSGPFLDRLDILMEVPALSREELASVAPGETSAQVRRRVCEARQRQHARQGKVNARLSPREVDRHCAGDERAKRYLGEVMQQMQLSARGYHRVQKLARTIADLAGGESVTATHLSEAVQLRRLFAAAAF